MKRLAFCLAVAVAVGACANDARLGDTGPEHAQANLLDRSGQLLARATASEEPAGVRVRLEAAGLRPGTYGAHIHTIGRCDPPSFDSAGPHWNPTTRQHGFEAPSGHHAGDLPNLVVGQTGQGSVEYLVSGARLANGAMALMDRDGAAVIVHERADDYRTDPSGNSGPRIACGVLH